MTKSVVDLCREQALSLAQLHERSGLDASRVMAIVEGRWTPSPRERERIASAFGVAVDDITWGHKTPIQHLWGHGPT
jgi:transcriptional regulator with XRE-family HTH domain